VLKLPKKVRICGFDYPIIYQEKVIMDGEEVEGICDRAEKIIQIRERLDIPSLIETLVHEVAHGYTSYADLDTVKNEEKFVSILSKAVITFIKDNPKTSKKLLEMILKNH
jgi:hypothetical protein